MTFKYLSILFSIILGLLIIYVIQRKDKYEKEPFPALVSVTALGGTLSIIIAFLLIIATDLVPLKQTIESSAKIYKCLYLYLVAAPIEELSKLLSLFIVYPFYRKELNEPKDGLIYICCVTAGFSLIENYFYANSETGNEFLIITRLLFSTPAHLSFSIFMGLGMYKFIKEERKISYLLKPFIASVILHGTYNSLLLYNIYFYFFWLYFLLIIRLGNSLLIYATAISPFRNTLENSIQGYTNPDIKTIFTCINCGSEHPKKTYYGDSFIIQKCNKCRYYISDLSSIISMFGFFANTAIPPGSYYQRFKKYSDYCNENLWTVMNKNFISPSKKVGFFSLKAFSRYLEMNNNDVISENKSPLIKLIVD